MCATMPVWFTSALSNEIMQNERLSDYMENIIRDIASGLIDILCIVNNLGGVLTNKDAENRFKGMSFFTSILKGLSKDYLTESQVQYIAKFYVDRLNDNHRVIPAVLEGYLNIMKMDNYNITLCGEFFTVLFREVSCQTQVRHDRYNIYLIIKMAFEKDPEYIITLGPDFIYGFISSIDGERDPRNLKFLFSFLPKFLEKIDLHHLADEVFDTISCYYPIDFHVSQSDLALITREDLADLLAPCLCAVPEFGEQCLVLLLEKLDSSLRVAKLDSLRLLVESTKVFTPELYGPFLKPLWDSISREIYHKTDEEIRYWANEALHFLLVNLALTADTDQVFENFIDEIIIATRAVMIVASTVAQFNMATKVLLSTARASQHSCTIVLKLMIPAINVYLQSEAPIKLQIEIIAFLGDLYEVVKYFNIVDKLKEVLNEIPKVCLAAVINPLKEIKMVGLKTIIKVESVLNVDVATQLIAVLLQNIKYTNDEELLSLYADSINAIARLHPGLIMDTVVKNECNLQNLDEDRLSLQKCLHILTNLASIDEFTKIIINEMLNMIGDNKESQEIVKALSNSISNTSLYSNTKISQIENDHSLIDSVLAWLFKKIHTLPEESIQLGYTIIAYTISSMPIDKQEKILEKHTLNILEKYKEDEIYYSLIYGLYIYVDKSVDNKYFDDIFKLSISLVFKSENETIRTRASEIVAHFLNKAENGRIFDLRYNLLGKELCELNVMEDVTLYHKLIMLNGWITKALCVRDSTETFPWLHKIVRDLLDIRYHTYAVEAIRLLTSQSPYIMSAKSGCRTSILYRQKIFKMFSFILADCKIIELECEESFLLAWGYVLEKTPRAILNDQVAKITPLIIDALAHKHTKLLSVMLTVLLMFTETKKAPVTSSLQTLLPRLVNTSKYAESMDVRLKSLQCLLDIANNYPTSALLPHKEALLLDLGPTLDDKKRLVRRKAVCARTRWFLVGAPGEKKIY